MKKVLIIKALCFVVLAAFAQQPMAKKPTLSPEAAFTQQFGESEITVQYARPSARGRKIFGGIVPFDSLWRTGAGESTSLKFKEEIIMGGKKMAVGKYALFTIPRADEWTIILNSDISLHGAFGYDAAKDVQRFTVKPAKTDRFYETFTIEINDFNQQGGASLNLIWENTLVKIPLESPLYESAKTAEKPAEVPKSDAHVGHDMSKMDNKSQNTEGVKKVETQSKTDIHAEHDMSKMDKKPQNTEGVKKTETMPKTDVHAGHDVSKMEKPMAEKAKNTEGSLSPKSETPNPKSVDLKTQFAAVFSAYYGLKDALVADNAKLAAEKGKAMKTALQSIETKAWTAKQRTAYDAVAKKLATDATYIGDNAAKIDQQRARFISLSNNIVSITKTLKINEEATYLQFCPMANDGKGAYWLSKENKVKNPYYGKSMLTCGSVKETLK